MRRVVAVFVMIAAMAAVAVAADAGTADPDGARQVFAWLNEFRSQNGKQPLQWDDRLAQAAVDHAYLCSTNRELSHQYSGEPVLRLRIAKFNVLLDRAGENLSMDSVLRAAHDGLIASPPHRANMLSADYNAVGIGVVTANGHYYIVEDFAHVLPQLSAAEVEAKIAAEFDALRANSGAPVLGHSSSNDLRDAACRMAASDDVSAKNTSVSGAQYVLAFTIADLQHLPEELRTLRDNRELGTYAIGACVASSQKYPNGVYWVAMALYGRSAGRRRGE